MQPATASHARLVLNKTVPFFCTTLYVVQTGDMKRRPGNRIEGATGCPSWCRPLRPLFHFLDVSYPQSVHSKEINLCLNYQFPSSLMLSQIGNIALPRKEPSSISLVISHHLPLFLCRCAIYPYYASTMVFLCEPAPRRVGLQLPRRAEVCEPARHGLLRLAVVLRRVRDPLIRPRSDARANQLVFERGRQWRTRRKEGKRSGPRRSTTATGRKL